MGFDDPNAAGGVMGTQPDGNANHGDSIDNATHGVGDQFNLNNATNADLPAFTAEDKAFMDELLPAIEALAETGEVSVLPNLISFKSIRANPAQFIASASENLATVANQPHQ